MLFWSGPNPLVAVVRGGGGGGVMDPGEPLRIEPALALADEELLTGRAGVDT